MASRMRRDTINTAKCEPLAPVSVPALAGLTISSPEPKLQEPFEERRQHARLDQKVPVKLSADTDLLETYCENEKDQAHKR